MKVLIFGTGHEYEKNKHKLVDFDILAFLDNDPNKQGKYKDGKIIDNPQNWNQYECDAIFLISIYYEAMRKQLLELGVPKDKIVDESHIGVFKDICVIYDYKLLEKETKKKCIKQEKNILVVAPELAITGAAVVFFYMAQLLIKNQYNVELLSRKKGAMLYEFLRIGVSVKVIAWWNMIEDEYFDGFDLVILNTILTHPIANRLKIKNIPVLWWLHEDTPMMRFFNIKRDDIPISENLHILSVGKRVEKAYIELTGDSKMEELCYGVECHTVKKNKKDEKKRICAVIGYVNQVKGQDLLLKAIEKYENKWLEKIEFWLIGSISEKDRAEFEKYKSVKVWGNIEHDRLLELFSDIDIVLCCSRHETMSVAVVEGMMHKKLCIVSSEAGNVQYCIHQENALIMESENVESLSEQIDWTLEHPKECQKIAEAGFEIYDKKFRMEEFEKNVLRIVEKYL